jgi:alkanesulfonate monooxygenase SsuD/methylene tetrahydromethanopterin reductase-like flavin-dependent oxidoreductase (luciferase family)
LSRSKLAEQVGFDYVWEVEHHFLGEFSLSSAREVFLAAAASIPPASASATASSFPPSVTTIPSVSPSAPLTPRY